MRSGGPRYRELTGQLDVGSSVSLPLVDQGACCGSNTWYSFGTAVLTSRTRDGFRVFAAHAAMRVMVMLRQIDLLRLTSARQVMAERKAFDVATGW